ncbi:hypothetical protein [Marinicrinis lubricantis]|uniref:Uncharacterized protein n=1 Tax=Marinicrinis lubricantis TaxID=2086470 RepID=A0ABW1ISC8_9BACL
MLVLLDLRIQSLDVLPDVIGYGLMWSAIHILGQYRTAYNKAWPYAAILTFLAVPELIVPPNQSTSAFVPSSESILQLAFTSLMLLLMMLLMHQFFTALSQHASDSGANDFAAETHSRLTLLWVLSAGSLFLFPFMINIESSLVTYFYFSASIFGIIALLLLIGTCRRAPSKIQDQASVSDDPTSEGNS